MQYSKTHADGTVETVWMTEAELDIICSKLPGEAKSPFSMNSILFWAVEQIAGCVFDQLVQSAITNYLPDFYHFMDTLEGVVNLV